MEKYIVAMACKILNGTPPPLSLIDIEHVVIVVSRFL